MGPSSSAGLNMAPLWPKVKMVFLLFRDGLEKNPSERRKAVTSMKLRQDQASTRSMSEAEADSSTHLSWRCLPLPSNHLCLQHPHTAHPHTHTQAYIEQQRSALKTDGDITLETERLHYEPHD